MNSIFFSSDRRSNPGKTFWTPFNGTHIPDLAQNLIFAGSLFVMNSSGQLKKRRFILTNSGLYYCSNAKSPPKKMCIISWKTLTIFTEENESRPRLGFSLSSGKISKDFYPVTSVKLQKWVRYLSTVAIATRLQDYYTIIQEAGKGSTATVFLALDRETQQKFAVKSVSKDNLLANKRALPALINEIEIMRVLSHPRLVKLHKIYEDDECVHLILDYMENGDLFGRVTRRGCFPEETALQFIKNLLEVLEYVHSKNIIHRDLKPENILMMDKENDTEFKIADFGLATLSSKDLTLRCGSPGYAAPELLWKNPYGVKVDIFSIGVILYVILTGRAAFYGRNVQEVLLNNRDCNINFYEKHWKNISVEAMNMVVKLTEKDPNLRYSASEALAHPWFLKKEAKKRTLKRASSNFVDPNLNYSPPYGHPNTPNFNNLSPPYGSPITLKQRLILGRKNVTKPINIDAAKEDSPRRVYKNRNLLINLRKLDPVDSRK
ncbi:unnamed protein product [Blepharisma stoltei]|uniref:Protein kinase domain-containing protein n=1 Tax=Blepharisma stoltei TaxID=1481888 RepID=A0AAU9JC03_9CILI|nr:unnamed protein product [Blepharisma stoltei]